MILKLLINNIISTSGGDYFAPLVAGTVTDTGYYEAFGMPIQRSNGMIDSLFKRSSGHAAEGPIIIKRTSNGGATWSESQVNVGGVLIEAHSISHGITATGRQIVFYQDDDTFATIKWAVRDTLTGNFTYKGTISCSPGFDALAPAPIKIKTLPEGQLRFGLYELNNAGTSAAGRFYDSDDDGETFTLTSTLYTRATQAPASPYTDWMCNEFDHECVDDTGVNATSKFIAIARVALPFDGGTYYTFLTSTGGTIWNQSIVEDPGSFVDDNGNTVSGPFSRGLLYRFLASNSPVSIKLHNGVVVVANGERALSGYKLKYITNTPAGAFSNIYSSWSAPTTLETYNATTAGSSIDCGYPDLFEASETEGGALELWAHHYDVSTLPKDPILTEDRCCIRQIQIL
jgi:hypothetical protein